MDLFDKIAEDERQKNAPLADLMRPAGLEKFFGQSHLTGMGKPLRLLMENRRPLSMILWGPPGVGKTTLARMYATTCDAQFHALNAVSSGVSDVRRVIALAEARRKNGETTILFIDEIHRFNKAQQDALLGAVETGTLFLIGATTENPSFEVISPLLSRCRVFTLKPLSNDELGKLLDETIVACEKREGMQIEVDPAAREVLIDYAGGDARELIMSVELSANICKPGADSTKKVDKRVAATALQQKILKYDKAGDAHYDTISAFIKSIRGSDPDATVHYLARMLEAGEDPLFIARRLIISASEDIGNADPDALVLTTAAFQAVHTIGMPEARIVLSQAATYCACAPKSNASYLAINAALQDIRSGTPGTIPMHLRNAPTQLMKDSGYGKEYQYPHDNEDGFVDEVYLPENMKQKVYYKPVKRGHENSIRTRLRALWPARFK